MVCSLFTAQPVVSNGAQAIEQVDNKQVQSDKGSIKKDRDQINVPMQQCIYLITAMSWIE
jgi:hypothetical protein